MSQFVKLAEFVECRPMTAPIHQTAIIKLTIYLKQLLTKLAHKPYTDWLVINVGAASAIRRERSAQNNFIFIGKIIFV